MSERVALLNAPVVTSNGTFIVEDCEVDEAKKLCRELGFTSYVGHAATAAVMSTLLEQEVVQTRAELKQAVNQVAIVFCLAARQPEGVVLSLEDVHRVGFTLRKIHRVA